MGNFSLRASPKRYDDLRMPPCSDDPIQQGATTRITEPSVTRMVARQVGRSVASDFNTLSAEFNRLLMMLLFCSRQERRRLSVTSGF